MAGQRQGIAVHVIGSQGRMGQACVAAVEAAEDLVLCGQSDLGADLTQALAKSHPQVAVEFTVPDAVGANVRTALEAGVHVVSGTTGLLRPAAEELGRLAEAKGLGFLLAPNFSIGVILMQRFAREAAKHFADVEIIEQHHERKQDAPSGTAMHTARLIAAAAGRPLNRDRPAEKELLAGCRGGRLDDVPIHAVRLPGLLAHQEVIFGGLGQILTIRHDTMDRKAFMPGVLLGIRAVLSRRGLIDSLEMLL